MKNNDLPNLLKEAGKRCECDLRTTIANKCGDRHDLVEAIDGVLQMIDAIAESASHTTGRACPSCGQHIEYVPKVVHDETSIDYDGGYSCESCGWFKDDEGDTSFTPWERAQKKMKMAHALVELDENIKRFHYAMLHLTPTPVTTKPGEADEIVNKSRIQGIIAIFAGLLLMFLACYAASKLLR